MWTAPHRRGRFLHPKEHRSLPPNIRLAVSSLEFDGPMPMLESTKTRRCRRRAIFFNTSGIPSCSFVCIKLAVDGIQVVAFTRHTPLDSIVSRWPSDVLAWTNAFRRLNSAVPDLLTHKLPTHQNLRLSSSSVFLSAAGLSLEVLKSESCRRSPSAK